jgi:hypothetical protein
MNSFKRKIRECIEQETKLIEKEKEDILNKLVQPFRDQGFKIQVKGYRYHNSEIRFIKSDCIGFDSFLKKHNILLSCKSGSAFGTIYEVMI